MSSSSDAYHHGDLRRALVQAGLEVLASRGISALSLREVARRAGVSQAAPYHHFPDKGALLSAIAEKGYDEFAGALRAGARKAGGGTLQRFQGIGIAYVRFAVDNPAMFRLLFRPELLDSASPPALFATKPYLVLQRAVASAIADGSIAGEVDSVALSAWCAVHGAATLCIDGPLAILGLQPEAIARTVTDVLGLGFIPRDRSAQ